MPVLDVLRIGHLPEGAQAILHTLSGIPVVTASSPLLNMSNLSSGVYLLRIFSGDAVSTHRVLKE